MSDPVATPWESLVSCTPIHAKSFCCWLPKSNRSKRLWKMTITRNLCYNSCALAIPVDAAKEDFVQSQRSNILLQHHGGYFMHVLACSDAIWRATPAMKLFVKRNCMASWLVDLATSTCRPSLAKMSGLNKNKTYMKPVPLLKKNAEHIPSKAGQVPLMQLVHYFFGGCWELYEFAVWWTMTSATLDDLSWAKKMDVTWRLEPLRPPKKEQTDLGWFHCFLGPVQMGHLQTSKPKKWRPANAGARPARSSHTCCRTGSL